MISQGKYVITLPRENDFYYTKLNSFKNDVISTTTNQVLLAPQN
jgi:hypothetical protein